MALSKNVKTTLRGTRKLYFEKLKKTKEINDAEAVRELLDFYMKLNPLSI